MSNFLELVLQTYYANPFKSHHAKIEGISGFSLKPTVTSESEGGPMGQSNPLIVLKFGGTSLATPERIRMAAQQCVLAKRQGYGVVAVVSAMAGETDRLLSLTHSVSPIPNLREVDVVASTGETVAAALTSLAVQKAGEKSRSLLGYQLPLITTAHYSQARILSLGTSRILESLQKGEIPILSGFQGISEGGQITTLGRGGSDLTAVAVAAALRAERCDIFTDVAGVFSADPRICGQAKRFETIEYDFLGDVAQLGAKVMHDRSVRLAEKYGVTLVVRSSFSDEGQTKVGRSYRSLKKNRAVTLEQDLAQVQFFSNEDVGYVSNQLSRKGLDFTGSSNGLLLKRNILPQFKNFSPPFFVNPCLSRVSLVSEDSGITMSEFVSVTKPFFPSQIMSGRRSLSAVVPQEVGEELVRVFHKEWIENQEKAA